MSTYQQTSLTTGLLSDEPLAAEHLGYLHARVQNKAHECVLRVFLNESVEHGINKAYIARRLGKRPEVVGRCLAAPGNWTLDTIAELLGSMGYDVDIQARSFKEPALPNRIHDIVIYKRTVEADPITKITYVGEKPIYNTFVENDGVIIRSTS